MPEEEGERERGGSYFEGPFLNICGSLKRISGELVLPEGSSI